MDTDSVPINKEVVFKSRIVNTNELRGKHGEGPVCARRGYWVSSAVNLTCSSEAEPGASASPGVGAASAGGPLSGPPRSWGSRHLQEKPQLVASALESELQASCLHNKPSGLPSQLPSP